MSNHPSRIFVSYSREDFDIVSRLAEDLGKAGMSAWVDKREISPGQHWDSAVESGLTDSDCVLVVLSPSSVNSRNVLDEISLALESRKVIVPILHRDCVIPFRLRRIQYLDFRGNYLDAYQELLTVLTNKRTPTNTVSADDSEKTGIEKARIFSRGRPALTIIGALLVMLVLAVGFFYRQLKKVPDITGEWHSEVFSDPNEGHPNRHQYYFKFKSDGEHLFGTVRWVDPPGEPTGIIYPVGNGKIEGNKISFDYFGGWFHGGAVGNTTREKESFVGTISGNKIRFIYQREDALPIDISATKFRDGPVDLSN
jgi:hypothetical protein